MNSLSSRFLARAAIVCLASTSFVTMSSPANALPNVCLDYAWKECISEGYDRLGAGWSACVALNKNYCEEFLLPITPIGGCTGQTGDGKYFCY